MSAAIKERRDAEFPRRRWPPIVKEQADAVFDALVFYDDTDATIKHADQIAEETGLDRQRVVRAISYLRNEFGDGFIITKHARHLSGYALADGKSQADAYINRRIKDEASRLRTIAQQIQARIQLWGRDTEALIIRKQTDRMVTDLFEAIDRRGG
jgi:biotin operon repressor